MNNIEIRVKGQAGLTKLARNLVNLNIKNNIQQALVGAAQRITTTIKTVTPVDTGFLKGSIRPESRPNKNEVVIAENSYARSGTPYGVYVSEGTSKMKARPYFDWGLEKEKGTIDDMSRRLGKKIETNILRGV